VFGRVLRCLIAVPVVVEGCVASAVALWRLDGGGHVQRQWAEKGQAVKRIALSCG
jgi:hypothetical protein